MADELAKVTEESARGGFFLFSGSASATVIMAISAIVIGRLLGPELYGQYNLVLVIPSLLLLFTDLGINAGIVKFAASLRANRKSESVPTMIRRGAIFNLLAGVAVFIPSLIFAGYFAMLINRPSFVPYIQIASISLVFQVIFATSTAAFIGLDKSEYSALAANVQAIAKMALQITFVPLGFSIAGALIGYVGGYIIASVLAGAILFSRLLKSKKNSEEESFGKTLRVLTRYGAPLYVSTLLTGLLASYQQVILAFFASDAAIGNYRAASNFVALLAVIPGSITSALLPAFSKLDSSTTEKVNTLFKRANKYTCLLIVPITILIILFSRQIVEIIYGPIYNSAPLFLVISSLSYFLVAIGSLGLTSLFNGLGKTRLTLQVTIVYFLLLIVLTPIFASTYDVQGALVASLISNIGGASYAAYIARKKLNIQFNLGPVTRIYLAAGLASIPSLILLLFTPLNGILTLIIGAGTYLFIFITLMPLVGIVNRGELNALASVTGKIPLLKLIVRPLLWYQRKILAKTRQPS
jgi:O-antigen/teichoic acid export membrane protein